MESNMSTYKDLTPAPQLDKKTLNKMVWMSCQLQASFNYERMQASGWLWSMLPGLKKIHTNKEDLAASMSHNLDFFNTHPFLVTFVMGIVLSMEQQKIDIQTIRAVRVAAMGPLGGIGDSLFWFTLVPIMAGICAPMAMEGNPVGPILFFIVTFGVEMALRYGLMYWSYALGTNAIGALTKNAKEFTRAASILGVFVVGALISAFGGGTKLAMEFAIKGVKEPLSIQAKLDQIIPTLIPFALTMLCYFLIKKKNFSPIKCIIVLLIIGILGAAFGIWDGGNTVYKSLIHVPWHA